MEHVRACLARGPRVTEWNRNPFSCLPELGTHVNQKQVFVVLSHECQVFVVLFLVTAASNTLSKIVT